MQTLCRKCVVCDSLCRNTYSSVIVAILEVLSVVSILYHCAFPFL